MISRDLAKKLYQTIKNYPDGMRQITNKFLWNRVLNEFPRLAEFFLTGRNKRALTTLERSLAEFIIQSELIKPYKPMPYHEHEYIWAPPNGGQNPPGPGPGGEENPKEPEGPPWEPGNFLCSAKLETGCYCNDDDNGQQIVITGTYPIYQIVITSGDAKLFAVSGLFTTRVTAILKGGQHLIGMVTIEVLMVLPTGATCDSNVNLFVCPEEICCEGGQPECHEDNQETIGSNSNTEIVFYGGSGPYEYTITGDGFWFDQGFTKTETTATKSFITIYTDASSCGVGEITILDRCKKTASCTIRNTSGQWGAVTPGRMCCGEKDGGGGCGAGSICRRTEGECRQSTRFSQCQGAAGSCNVWDADCSHCDGIPACSNGFDDCIPFGECGVDLEDCGTGSQVKLCYEPCASPPGAGGFTRGLCYINSGGYPYYQLWECIP
jgi:hypothetical protein